MIASGIFLSGKAAWAHFEHPLVGCFGVTIMYAPNIDVERVELWQEMADTLDKNRKWLVVGDFNNMEESFDRQGGLIRKNWRNKDGINLRESWGWRTHLLNVRVPCGIARTTRSTTATTHELNLPLALVRGCCNAWTECTTPLTQGKIPSAWNPLSYQAFASQITHQLLQKLLWRGCTIIPHFTT